MVKKNKQKEKEKMYECKYCGRQKISLENCDCTNPRTIWNTPSQRKSRTEKFKEKLKEKLELNLQEVKQ